MAELIFLLSNIRTVFDLRDRVRVSGVKVRIVGCHAYVIGSDLSYRSRKRFLIRLTGYISISLDVFSRSHGDPIRPGQFSR